MERWPKTIYVCRECGGGLASDPHEEGQHCECPDPHPDPNYNYAPMDRPIEVVPVAEVKRLAEALDLVQKANVQDSFDERQRREAIRQLVGAALNPLPNGKESP